MPLNERTLMILAVTVLVAVGLSWYLLAPAPVVIAA